MLVQGLVDAKAECERLSKQIAKLRKKQQSFVTLAQKKRESPEITLLKVSIGEGKIFLYWSSLAEGFKK